MIFVCCLKLIMVAIAAGIAFSPLNKSLSVFSGYCLILLTIALPFTAIQRPMQLKIKPSLFCLLCLIIVLISSFLAEPAFLDFDLLKDILMFICTYAAIAVREQTFRQRDLKHILYIGKALSLVYVAYTFLPFSFRYTISNEWGTKAFTLSMGNPNATAISVMFCIMLLIIDYYQTNSNAVRFLDYVTALLLLYTVYLLESRTVMFCSIILLLLPVLRKIRVNMVCVFMAFLIPALSVGLQIYLAERGTVFILGKPLASGRDLLYIAYFKQLLSDPMGYWIGKIGIHRLANYHNAPLAIVMNFGVVGLVIYYLFWYFEIKKNINCDGINIVRTVATFGMLMFFIHSSAEAAPMLGSVLYGAQMMIICRVAKDEFIKE